MCAIVCLFFNLALSAQTDVELNSRLNEYMRLTRELKFEPLMDYVHPAIFKIASKEQMIEVFEQSFDNEQMKIVVDSTAILNISPVFQSRDTAYRKIDYYMELLLSFKDTAIQDNNFIETTVTALKSGFPNASVNYEVARKGFAIKGSNLMLAIKPGNNAAQWMFFGVEKKQAEVMKTILSADVINHFKLL